MKRKLYVVCMTMCMILTLVGCVSKGEDKKDGKKSNVKNEKSIESKDKKDKSKNDELENDDTTETKEKSNKLTAESKYAKLKASKGFEFESNGDGTCTLEEIGDCTDEDIVIPSKSPSGDKVTNIAEGAFYECEDINSIIFAGKTMELDDQSFQCCEAKKIIITGCDLVIGEGAFSYCEDVGEIYISNSKIEIEELAFYETGKNMNITINNCKGVLDKKAFQSCAIKGLDINECSVDLGDNAFSYCDDLENINIEACTMNIDSYAFYETGDDMKVSIADCNLELKDKAFQSCGMSTLSISKSDTKIGKNAFSYSEDLTDVVLGANKIEIGSYAFYECTSLEKVSIAKDSKDDDLEIDIDKKAFQSCAVQKVVIGRGKVNVGSNAFSYCEDLTSVEFKGSALKVGKYAFYECPDKLSIKYKGENYNKENIEDVGK